MGWLVDYRFHIEAASDLATTIALLGGIVFAVWKFGVFRTFRVNFEVSVSAMTWAASADLVTLSITVSNEGEIPVVLPDHIGHRVRLTVVDASILELSRQQGIGVVWDAASRGNRFTEPLALGGLPIELRAGQARSGAVSFFTPPEAVVGLVEVDVIGRRPWGRSADIRWSTSLVVNKEMDE